MVGATPVDCYFCFCFVLFWFLWTACLLFCFDLLQLLWPGRPLHHTGRLSVCFVFHTTSDGAAATTYVNCCFCFSFFLLHRLVVVLLLLAAPTISLMRTVLPLAVTRNSPLGKLPTINLSSRNISSENLSPGNIISKNITPGGMGSFMQVGWLSFFGSKPPCLNVVSIFLLSSHARCDLGEGLWLLFLFRFCTGWLLLSCFLPSNTRRSQDTRRHWNLRRCWNTRRHLQR